MCLIVCNHMLFWDAAQYLTGWIDGFGLKGQGLKFGSNRTYVLFTVRNRKFL